jgi:hypothetical protein
VSILAPQEMTLAEMAEALMWDFALRSQHDEDRAYRNYKRFMDASERVELAHNERRYQQRTGRIL